MRLRIKCLVNVGAKASNQRGSRQVLVASSRVPRGIALGPILPSCARVTSGLGKPIDGRVQDEVRSEIGQQGLFYQRHDGLAWVRSRGTPHGDFSGLR